MSHHYVYCPYPRFKYHHAKEPVIVESKEAEAELGSEWVDSPAHVRKPAVPSAAEPVKVAQAMPVRSKNRSGGSSQKENKS